MTGPLRNLPVAQKLFVSFGVLCLLMIGVGAIGLIELSRADARLEQVYRENLQASTLLGQVRADVQEGRALTATLILRSPAADVGNIEQAIKRLDAQVDSTWAKYTGGPMAGRQQYVATFSGAMVQYRQVRDDALVPAARADNMAQYLSAQAGQIDPLASTMTGALNNLARVEDEATRATMAEARTTADKAQLITSLLIGAALVIAVLLAVVVSRGLSRPLRRTVEVLEGLAEGRLDQRLTGPHARDEVGRMAGALNAALDRLTTTLRGISDNASTLAVSSEQLTAVAGQMSSSAARSASRANDVSSASEQISFNIATVSAGADEIGTSIGEIARSTSSAAEVAGTAVRISGEAGAILQQLGASSQEIVSVIKIITSIAEQTNLLALNATIEAARAGDAGKGFAVVAGEVKELAQETARATEDIRTRVGAIQADSAAAVAAIGEIGAVIDQINATQTAIAAAVEEQTATTAEISRSVGQAADGSSSIAETIAGVAEAARQVTEGATETQQTAAELAGTAAELQATVAAYRT
jgi:methyl-accepting chemotaxis protein